MGDFGSATEAMRIIDLFALQIFAKKSGRCNFRLLQHYLPKPALSNRSKTATYSITSSAARNGETRRLSDLEVDDQLYFRSVLT